MGWIHAEEVPGVGTLLMTTAVKMLLRKNDENYFFLNWEAHQIESAEEFHPQNPRKCISSGIGFQNFMEEAAQIPAADHWV
jgi:predicted tellurium resistance membrane protein TerC